MIGLADFCSYQRRGAMVFLSLECPSGWQRQTPNLVITFCRLYSAQRSHVLCMQARLMTVSGDYHRKEI